MSTEEEYNKLIADKLNAQSFEGTEQDWNDALSLIEAHDKKKKRRFIVFFWSLGIVTVLGTAIYLNQGGSHESSKVLNEIAEKKDVPPSSENKVLEKDDRNREQSVITIEENNKPENAIVRASDKELEIKPTNNEAKRESSTKTKEIKPEVSKKEVQQKVTAKAGLTPNKKPEVKIVAELNTREQEEKADKEVSSTVATTKKETENNIQGKSEKAATGTVSTALSASTSIKTPDISNDSLATKIVENKKDSLPKEIALETKQPITPISLPPSFEIYGAIGGHYDPVKNSGYNVVDVLNPSAGLYFVKSFPKRFGFGAGLFYTVQSASNLDPRIYKSTTQEFGYKASIIQISPYKFHYLKLPLYVTYSFTKNRFMLGANAGYLLACRSNVQTYTESYGNTSEPKLEKTFGYMNGLSKFDVSLSLVYTRTLYKRIGLGAQAEYGFLDTKDNTYFGSNRFDRNMNFNLFINYRIK